MYTTYFIIGFVTSFGWWSAGKAQKSIDSTSVQITVNTVEVTGKSKQETIDNTRINK